TKYSLMYPDVVKPYFNSRNMGVAGNSYRAFKTLKSDYFAVLEGDDYWTSPHGLQKQVAFLEAHPDFMICGGYAVHVYEDDRMAPDRWHHQERQDDCTIEDVICRSWWLHMSAATYRNLFFKNRPPWYFRSKWSCEMWLMISHARFGKVHHFDEELSVHRVH